MTVYKKAAKAVANDNNIFFGCCEHLKDKGATFTQRLSFTSKFYPSYTEDIRYNGKPYSDYWMGKLNKENTLCRSLALLFMHEMYK